MRRKARAGGEERSEKVKVVGFLPMTWAMAATPATAAAVPAGRRRAARSGLSRTLHVLRAVMPRGRMLPAHLLERRHRTIVTVLAAHVPALLAFGLLRGYALGHMLFDIGPVVVLSALAMAKRFPLRWRMVAACTGLVTCSAMLVHLWGGVIEAHFHFFVVIGLLTLYQDWVPFLLAIAYVIVHHGVMGVIAPHSVYNNPQAAANPWRWALIHGGFVLAASPRPAAASAPRGASRTWRPGARTRSSSCATR